MIRWLRRLIKRHVTVTVVTSKRKPTDFDRLRDERCRELAEALGRTWPPKVTQ